MSSPRHTTGDPALDVIYHARGYSEAAGTGASTDFVRRMLTRALAAGEAEELRASFAATAAATLFLAGGLHAILRRVMSSPESWQGARLEEVEGLVVKLYEAVYRVGPG